MLAGKLPKRAWQKLSASPGAKGHRYRTTGELAYYRCHSTWPARLRTLVRTAGSRWRVEETFQAGKGLAGLDEHQVRRCSSWRRWVTLPSSAQRNMQGALVRTTWPR